MLLLEFASLCEVRKLGRAADLPRPHESDLEWILHFARWIPRFGWTDCLFTGFGYSHADWPRDGRDGAPPERSESRFL